VWVAAGKYTEARAAIEAAVERARVLGIPSVSALAFDGLGRLEIATSHHSQAQAALEQAARSAEAAGDDAMAAGAVATMVSLIGWRLEQPAQGLTLAPIAEGMIARIGGDPALEAQLAEAVGDAQWQAGNRSASLMGYRQALALLLKLQGEDSGDVARLHSSVGWILTEQGHLSEARGHLERSRQIREALFGAEHPSLSATWNELGSLSMGLGDPTEARRCFEKDLGIVEQTLGPDATRVARELLNYVETLPPDDRAAEALPLIDRAERILMSSPDAPPSHQTQLHRMKALVAQGLGQWPQAVQHARRSLEIAERAGGKEHPDVAFSVRVLARALAGDGQHKAALEAFDRSLGMIEKLGTTGDAAYPIALGESGRVLVALGRVGEGVERLERAGKLIDAVEGNERGRAALRLSLAEALWQAGTDGDRARALARAAAQGYAKAGREGDAKRAEAWAGAHPSGNEPGERHSRASDH
jgi:tetratricopeptide (TPR) repeat protein